MFDFVFKIQIVFYAICALLLVYLFFRRLEQKKHEDFENRDN
jgi:membrane protein implicated in regulation of membrane protease activity